MLFECDQYKKYGTYEFVPEDLLKYWIIFTSGPLGQSNAGIRWVFGNKPGNEITSKSACEAKRGELADIWSKDFPSVSVNCIRVADPSKVE